MYLEIEIILIDRFSVFSYLEKSNLFRKQGQEIFLHVRSSWCLAPIIIICSTLNHKVCCPECTGKEFLPFVFQGAKTSRASVSARYSNAIKVAYLKQ